MSKVIKPEWIETLKKSWNDRELFIRACVKPVDPSKKAKLSLGNKDDNKDDNSMDFREFVALMENLGLFPEPFNKSLLAKVHFLPLSRRVCSDFR